MGERNGCDCDYYLYEGYGATGAVGNVSRGRPTIYLSISLYFFLPHTY